MPGPLFVKAALVAALLALLVVGGALGAPGKGQAIGQDEVRLALTRCTNAGGGNGGEIESGQFAFGAYRIIESDCLREALGLQSHYAVTQVLRISPQASCIHSDGFFRCEVDPGNSAARNRAREGVE